MFEVNFQAQNVRVGRKRWLFANRAKGRFEWLALLAIRRVRRPSDSWVTLDAIARLPTWSGRTRQHISGNIARYLEKLEQQGAWAVEAESRWVGPYRLRVLPTFDIPIAEAEDRLGLRKIEAPIPRAELYRFTFSFALAQVLMFQGKLRSFAGNQSHDNRDGAHDILARLTEDKAFRPRLRLLASIAAVGVLFQLGRFQAARKTLDACAPLLKTVNDHALKANYHLERAWSYQRGASGTRANRSTEVEISRARACAEKSGDRASFGRIAYRTSGFLTKKGRHLESIEQLLYAVEAALITGNVYELQAYCVDMGSVIHRLGPKSYKEAQEWIILGIEIASRMGIGRDNPHGEVILGKSYAELGDANSSRRWLEAAEKIAKDSKNALAFADTKMVWAFWHQRFGTKVDLIRTLVEALQAFRGLREFDCRQKEKYMAKKFPSVWPEVIRIVGGTSRSAEKQTRSSDNF